MRLVPEKVYSMLPDQPPKSSLSHPDNLSLIVRVTCAEISIVWSLLSAEVSFPDVHHIAVV